MENESYTLALDSSRDGTCAAVFLGTTLKAWQADSELSRVSSAKALAAIRDVLSSSGITLEEAERVLFCRGPGSFTSLRVGWATLAGLFAARPGGGPELFLASSLMVRALSARRGNELAVALMRAGRGKLYAGVYDGAKWLAPERSFTPEEFLASDFLSVGPELRPRVVCGDGLELFPRAAAFDGLARSADGAGVLPEAFATMLSEPDILERADFLTARLNYPA